MDNKLDYTAWENTQINIEIAYRAGYELHSQDSGTMFRTWRLIVPAVFNIVTHETRTITVRDIWFRNDAEVLKEFQKEWGMSNWAENAEDALSLWDGCEGFMLRSYADGWDAVKFSDDFPTLPLCTVAATEKARSASICWVLWDDIKNLNENGLREDYAETN